MIKNGWTEELDRLKKYENMWEELRGDMVCFLYGDGIDVFRRIKEIENKYLKGGK